MVEGKRAVVEPRVVSPICCGVVVISGAGGSGKTVALQHLAAVLPGGVTFLDEGAHIEVIEHAAASGLVVCADARGYRSGVLDCFAMAPWGRDEAMEYLMATHPERCGDVLRRLAEHADEFSETSPELWCAVLDGMARTSDLGPRDALARNNRSDSRWLRHRLVRVMADGAFISARVLGSDPTDLPRCAIDGALAEAVRLLRRHEEAREVLRTAWARVDTERQPLVASLLFGLDRSWRPDDYESCDLCGAELAGAEWSGASLPGLRFCRADLDGANMESALLDGANFRRARLREARLDGASLAKATFDRALLGRAQLRHARALKASFLGANLVEADLTAACLERAKFAEADLRDARLVRADLSRATLSKAQIDGADFSRANLASAFMAHLDLRRANWTGARFEGAILIRCHLEGLSLPGAIFDRASLLDAHLTATDMPGASFRGANLCRAFLGEVSWEGADLRDADLTQANFHMGSTREGLLDSVIASEGTRTGYYTDDYQEQSFKSPEEIRKANLCRADLRGALVHDTDFYLVDLRGARYDQDQLEHFRRCRAILHAKRM
ncbi:MAG: pentapeptide repeat-containing protein [Planctomycetota bacterium]|jgi:uncharacterized protein YjbI with pentapeptide repeats